MVCAVGPATPGDVFHIRYEGTVHECQANQYGVWAFIRKVEHIDTKHPMPELLDEDASAAQARRQMEERAEVVRQKIRAKINEMRGPPTESLTSDE